ncbi:uncharacterized protein [Dendropsophus ebraccatus]|uniref:uncharacterized protein isoform X2 n=1 Tax=Dendropsophus ebraccatus TaxID=150705 RepID=UPI003831105E
MMLLSQNGCHSKAWGQQLLVHSLRCYSCTDGQCKTTTIVPCPEGSACLLVHVKNGSSEYDVTYCTLQSECKQPPAFIPSGASFSQTCCYTDLCNSAIVNKMALSIAGFLVLVSLYVSRF